MKRFTFAALALCAAQGCHRPALPRELTSREIAVPDRSARDVLLDAGLDTLRAHRFKPDRVDRRAGTITTFPVTSQQFFEFWRSDVAGPSDLLEATLTTVRRRAEIRLTDGATPEQQRLVVTVYRERLSAPDRQYNTSAAAFRVFSMALPSTAGERIVPARDRVWLPAGRDGPLERRLMAQMTSAAGRTLRDRASLMAPDVP